MWVTRRGSCNIKTLRDKQIRFKQLKYLKDNFTGKKADLKKILMSK